LGDWQNIFCINAAFSRDQVHNFLKSQTNQATRMGAFKFSIVFVSAILISQVSFAKYIDNLSFIVSGDPAEIADFPHHLGLSDLRAGPGALGNVCGASNIHRVWALTAAHCLVLFSQSWDNEKVVL